MQLTHVQPAELDLMLGRLRQVPRRAVEAMMASLRSKGQLSALVAARQDGLLVLVDGFVRQCAATQLGLPSLRVEVVELSAVQMKAQLYLRNRERGLLLVEQCRLVHELSTLDGQSQVEIAALLERHKSWVCRRLALYRQLSPRLLDDLSLGLLGPGAVRRLAQLPVCNQEELVCVARREALGPADTAALVDLWQRAPDPRARQYVLDQPRDALRRARGGRDEQQDPRLSAAAQALLRSLNGLTASSVRIKRLLHEGLGEPAPEGVDVIASEFSQATCQCTAALDAVDDWIARYRQGATIETHES